MRLRWGTGVLSRTLRRAGSVVRRQIRVFGSRDKVRLAAMDSKQGDNDELDHVAPEVHDELEPVVPNEPAVDIPHPYVFDRMTL